MLSIKSIHVALTAGAAISLCGCPRSLPPSVAVNDSTMETVRAALEEGESSGSSGEVAALANPTGWATLSGTFKISGTAPPNQPLTVNKDVEVCAPGGKQVLDDIVLVGPGNELQNVLIYVASNIPTDNAAWLHESYNASRNGEVIFDQKDCIFLSRLGAMWSTQTLRVLNSDPIGHNTNLSSVRGAKAANMSVPANSSVEYQPGAASPAPFPVSCSIHPWMKASMMVCEHPYFSVTDANGAFQIVNVPAGVELEFRVWHEKAGYIQAVTIDNAAAKWSKGRFKRTFSTDENVTMNVVIESSVLQ